MDVTPVAQMGTSIVVAWTDPDGAEQMAEIRPDGTIGATVDSDHFRRNLGGYLTDLDDPAAAARTAAAAAPLLTVTPQRT